MTQRDERSAERQLFRRGTECLAPPALHLVRVLEQVVERAVLRDQLSGRLGPDALNARDVVGVVPHQGEHVDDLRGLNAGLRLERLRRDFLVVVDVEEGDRARGRIGIRQPGFGVRRRLRFLPDAGRRLRNRAPQQLLQVLILTHNPHPQLRMRLSQGRHKRRDHVVGLEPLRTNNRHADRLKKPQAPLHLWLKIIRRRRAIGLVLGIQPRPERAPIAGNVERDRDVLRLPAQLPLPAEQFEQHPHEAERHVRRLLGDRTCHRRSNGVVRAEELGVAVDEVEGGGRTRRGCFWCSHACEEAMPNLWFAVALGCDLSKALIGGSVPDTRE